MAKFRVIETSFIDNALRKPGDIVEIDTDIMQPGNNLEPVNKKKPAPVDDGSPVDGGDQTV